MERSEELEMFRTALAIADLHPGAEKRQKQEVKR